jgi:hypothetical protein
MLTLAENSLEAGLAVFLKIRCKLWLPFFLNVAGNPINTKISSVTGFSSGVIVGWAQQHLSNRWSLLCNGLACFRSLLAAGNSHSAVVHGDAIQMISASSDGSTFSSAT